MKPYEEYQSTEYDWLPFTPAHWEKRYLFQVNDEQRISNKNVHHQNLLSLSYGNIKRKDINSTKGLLPESFDTYQMVYDGNIILRLTDLQNDHKSLRVGLATQTGIITSAYTCLKPKNVSSKFIYYILHSLDLRKVFYGMGGGLRQSIGFKELRYLQLYIPPRPEQDQIIKFLDNKISKINKFIKDKKREIELLKETKQAEINHAVTKGLNRNVPMKDSGVDWLGDIPEHWEVRRLKKSASIINQKGNAAGEQYVGLENIVSWTGKFVETPTFNVESVSNQFKKNDVLFGKLRPYLAKCIIAGFDGVCSSEILVLRGFVGNVSYLQNILLSYNLIYYINASTYGAKMPRASWNFIGNCAIPLPPMDEQLSIVNYIEKKSENINRLISGIEAEIHLAQEYKASLISEVVTGKVDVRDVKVSEDFESVTMEEAEAETEEVIEE